MQQTKLPVHIHDSGMPYIKYADIPEQMRQEFAEWFIGQTALMLDDGGTGVYPWDWDNFLAHIEGREEFWD